MKVSEGSEWILSPNSRPVGGKETVYRSLRRRQKGNSDAGRKRRWVGSALVVTPLRQWKFHDRDFIPAAAVSVSSRKIAAGLWQFASTAGGGARWGYGLFHRLGYRYELNCSMKTPKYAMEGATTKWDSGYLKVQIATSSVASALQVELLEARNRIKKLEAKRAFTRIKLEKFARKLNEEKASWIRRKHRKTNVLIEHLKEQTMKEKRRFQKMDTLNSKLLGNLADSKKSAKKFAKNYEKEKKVRVFLQEVCTELAKEIEKEKAKIGALKSEHVQVLEKVEEERKMLQMIEAWHEECVQMKLANAKLVLEEKYSEMSHIIAELESFLRSTTVNSDTTKNKKNQIEVGANELSHSPQSSDKGTVIQAEDPNSSFEQSVSRFKYISSGKRGEDHSKHHESMKSKFSETSSVLSKKPRKKGPSPRNSKVLNGPSSSNVSSISQERVSGEGAVYSHGSVAHWCRPDPRNPHIVRGMQGRIEWRRGIQRRGSRAEEGIEARLVTQKMQLCSVLKNRGDK